MTTTFDVLFFFLIIWVLSINKAKSPLLLHYIPFTVTPLHFQGEKSEEANITKLQHRAIAMQQNLRPFWVLALLMRPRLRSRPCLCGLLRLLGRGVVSCIWSLAKKFKLQGPPLELLLHETALCESDSMMIWWFFTILDASDIFMAQWMAKTSAELISIGGIGHENRHMKEPTLFRRTPPMALRLHLGSYEASTFHLSSWCWGGLHEIDQWISGQFIFGRVFDHCKHQGFPFIHHDSLTKISSWISWGEHEDWLFKSSFRIY